MKHASTCCAAAPWWLDDDVDSATSDPDSAPIPEEKSEPTPHEVLADIPFDPDPVPEESGAHIAPLPAVELESNSQIANCDTCPACDGSGFVDVPLSHDRGVRRDCAACGHFLSFPIWTPRKDLPK